MPLRLIAPLVLGLLVAPVAAAAVIPEMQLRRALVQQQRLIGEAPRDAKLWNDLGNLLMLGERRAEAEEAYGRSLELDPELVTARYNLALLYQEIGRPGRSRRELQRILKHHPDHAWARYYLGVLYSEGGQRKAAIREFARAIRLDPGLTDPTINPHVFDNELLADAALHAYADTQGAELAPRLYENRERVVRSMVLEPTVLSYQEEAGEASDEPEDDEPDEEDDDGGR